MDKEQILTKIQDCGIVAVVRAESADQASRIADACIEGGVAAIELTFTVPHADKVIEELAKRYTPEQMILGAGTVMDAPTARIAMLSGANFVVSPYFDPETVKMCNRYRVAVMPGIMTVKEAVAAMEAGAVAVGAGSSLTAGAKTGDYQRITDTARKFVENIKAAREGR